MALSEADRRGHDHVPDIPKRHRKIGPLARRFFQVYLGTIAEVLEPFGLDLAFYGVLVELHETPGIDQRTLGDALGIDRTTVSQMVEQLDRQQLVTRAIDPQDRRARKLMLTEKGDKLRLEIRPKMIAAQQRFEAPLSVKERPVFLQMLYRIVVAHLGVEHRGGFRRRIKSSRPSP